MSINCFSAPSLGSGQLRIIHSYSTEGRALVASSIGSRAGQMDALAVIIHQVTRASVDDLFDRAWKTSSLHRAELDGTVFAKHLEPEAMSSLQRWQHANHFRTKSTQVIHGQRRPCLAAKHPHGLS